MTRSAPRFVTIQDPGDERLSPYRSLKGKVLEQDGIFIAEGEKVVRSMVASDCRIASCLTSTNSVDRYRTLLAVMAKRGVPVYIADRPVVEGIIGFRFHQGIMAVGYCPEKLALSDLHRALQRPGVVVALNAVNDPQNVGIIVRNAAAFGARALIVDRATYDPYYRKAVRVSMGTIFDLPVLYTEDLGPVLRRLKKEYNTRVIAATPGRGSIAIAAADFSGKTCLVFGNEDTGIAGDILRVADARVRIPIAKTVDSLNVASASAVFLHAAGREK